MSGPSTGLGKRLLRARGSRGLSQREAAEELGVHFILEGSVRKAGQRVRVTAQLINGQDGSHTWAERYDGALEDVFDLQEQITSQVVASISPHVTDAELERVGRGERVFDEAHSLGWKAMEVMRSAFRTGDPIPLQQAIDIHSDMRPTHAHNPNNS